MLKIETTNKSETTLAKKYCRLVLTNEPASHHRFVEQAGGVVVYKMGIGKGSKVTARSFRLLARSIIQAAKSHKVEFLALDFAALNFPALATHGDKWLASTLVENLLLADYEFTTYKTKKADKKNLKEVLIFNLSNEAAKEGIKRGLILGDYINQARTIANTPGCDLSPTDFGNAAKKMTAKTKISLKVLGEKEIKKLKMGALLAVGQGTKSETKFIIAEYWGAGKEKGKKVSQDKKPIVLIGKGITYDTGGLNVKPTGFMHEMHMDMSGGSAVLAAISAAAKLGLKKNIIALVPTAENSISDTAMRAGDIVTAMNGKTIEVLHTDAEGRMVLADALTYSERYGPKVILDVATLTGASLVALGQQASAVMTKDEALASKLTTLGETSGDLVWPLPLWDEYKAPLKSHRADISNIATNFSRFGGAIEGGTFLSFFAPKNVPWVHIDMAPRMDSTPGDKLAKGSTGEPIRLLVAFIEQA
ncbi:MAG TPA: leucyl aminopeptidase [Candidatus Paceibacterota bacterium]|nr:leucyl aminopeptidase [Candidatus Paceibacterota bacterium]HMO83065.1 leucyl aminopeptidase [Candidatus Paceibacterota bacterium]